MWLKMGKWVVKCSINILAPWTPEFTTGSNPVKPMWSSCETHVKLLWMWNTLWNKQCFLHQILRFILPSQKMCEIEHIFSNWKCQVKQYVKYPLIVRNILWNQNPPLKYKTSHVKKYVKFWDTVMGLKSMWNTLWNKNVHWEFSDWCSPMKKCVKSWDTVSI